METYLTNINLVTTAYDFIFLVNMLHFLIGEMIIFEVLHL